MIQELLKEYREIHLLGTVSSLMHWDMETVMPSGAAEGRAEMMSLVSQLIHRKTTSKDFVERVLRLEPEALSGTERRQAELLRVYVLKQNAFDEDFVRRSTELQVTTHESWKKARQAKDFSLVRGALEKMVALKREEADRLQSNAALKSYFAGRSRYEILMDDFEARFPAQKIRALLSELRASTVELLPRVLEKTGAWAPTRPGTLAMPNEQQRKLGEEISKEMGLDYGRARLDTSVHPFCTHFNDEVRITTRHDPEDFTECLLGVIHETGHALYEQNLPKEFHATPAGASVSLGVHESQSRFMENMIGRSRPFARYLSRKTGIDADLLFRHLNRVQRSYIRTEADEVTYNLHIALRMALEEDLIEGRLEARDLPERWNREFEAMMGLKVPDDSLGCMQDTHWYGGAFGYFPTYSLGNLLAAELFADFRKQVPDWESQIERGHFEGVVGFLREKIHRHAATKPSLELMRETLGRELGTRAFTDYVKAKWDV